MSNDNYNLRVFANQDDQCQIRALPKARPREKKTPHATLRAGKHTAEHERESIRESRADASNLAQHCTFNNEIIASTTRRFGLKDGKPTKLPHSNWKTSHLKNQACEYVCRMTEV